MAFSNKQRAEYVELINQQLDNIPIDSLEDFEIVKRALQIVLEDGSKLTSHFPEKYQERMFYIKDYLNSPEDYVEDETNYPEYEGIIFGKDPI